VHISFFSWIPPPTIPFPNSFCTLTFFQGKYGFPNFSIIEEPTPFSLQPPPPLLLDPFVWISLISCCTFAGNGPSTPLGIVRRYMYKSLDTANTCLHTIDQICLIPFTLSDDSGFLSQPGPCKSFRLFPRFGRHLFLTLHPHPRRHHFFFPCFLAYPLEDVYLFVTLGSSFSKY